MKIVFLRCNINFIQKNIRNFLMKNLLHAIKVSDAGGKQKSTGAENRNFPHPNYTWKSQLFEHMY